LKPWNIILQRALRLRLIWLPLDLLPEGALNWVPEEATVFSYLRYDGVVMYIFPAPVGDRKPPRRLERPEFQTFDRDVVPYRHNARAGDIEHVMVIALAGYGIAYRMGNESLIAVLPWQGEPMDIKWSESESSFPGVPVHRHLLGYRDYGARIYPGKDEDLEFLPYDLPYRDRLEKWESPPKPGQQNRCAVVWDIGDADRKVYGHAFPIRSDS
jgi:hypothetical protein